MRLKLAAAELGDYAELTKTMTTGEETVTVRSILGTIIGCKYDQGHVAYDDCSLERRK